MVGVGDDDVHVAVVVVIKRRGHVDVVGGRRGRRAGVEALEPPVDIAGDEAAVPQEPDAGLGDAAVGRVRGHEDVGPAVAGEVVGHDADHGDAGRVRDGDLVAAEMARAVVLVVDEDRRPCRPCRQTMSSSPSPSKSAAATAEPPGWPVKPVLAS